MAHAWRLRDDEVREASVTVRRADMRVVARWFRFGDSPDGPRRYPECASPIDAMVPQRRAAGQTADTPQRWFCGCVPHDAPGGAGSLDLYGVARSHTVTARWGSGCREACPAGGNRLDASRSGGRTESRRRERGRSTLGRMTGVTCVLLELRLGTSAAVGGGAADLSRQGGCARRSQRQFPLRSGGAVW